MQKVGFRRGVFVFEKSAADICAGGSDNADFSSGGFVYAFEHKGGARLAFCPGKSDYIELFGRIAEEIRACERKQYPRVFDFEYDRIGGQ